jgi:hypothetical protein
MVLCRADSPDKRDVPREAAVVEQDCTRLTTESISSTLGTLLADGGTTDACPLAAGSRQFSVLSVRASR